MIVQELVARLGLQVDEQVFKRADAAMRGLTVGLAGIAAGVGAAVVGLGFLVQQTAKQGDSVAALSEKTGIATDALQELQFAAKMSDTTAESLTAGLRGLSRAAFEAAQGGSEAAAAFAEVGVDIRGADGQLLSADKLLVRIADKFARMNDGMAKSALARKLFGRSGDELIPMLNKGAEGIDTLRRRAHELGVVLNEETIKASEAYDDATKELTAAFEGLRNEIAGPLIESFTKVIKAVTKWVSENRKWIGLGIKKVVDGVGAAFKFAADHINLFKFAILTAAVAWGVHALAAGAATFGLIHMVKWYATLGAMAAATAIKTAAVWLLAAAPFIALAALIVLIADELYTFATGGDSMLGRMIKWFDKFNADDNPFVALLKALGSLLFDLSDPEKWSRLGAAIEGALKAAAAVAVDWMRSAITAMIGTIPGAKALGLLGTVAGLVGGESGRIFQSAVEAPFGGGASSPTASVQNSSSHASTSSTDARKQTVNVNVDAKGAQDPHAVGQAAGESVRDVLDQELRNASVAVGN